MARPPSKLFAAWNAKGYSTNTEKKAMSNLDSLQAELTLKMSEIDAICANYGYDVTPTLLLRHDKGASLSFLISNDSLSKVVLCIAELGEIGKQTHKTPHEAILTLFKGES
jgi:hypothetical protein